MEYIIKLSDAEQKAMEYITVSPADWINNAVKERARLAIEEIFQIEVERMLSDPNITDIPADRESVILASNIKLAAERNSEML